MVTAAALGFNGWVTGFNGMDALLLYGINRARVEVLNWLQRC
jgi:hypothetical protein